MKKHRQKYCSTWSEQEKKAILSSERNMTANEVHQVHYAECVYRKDRRKTAMARMDERIKSALRFL